MTEPKLFLGLLYNLSLLLINGAAVVLTDTLVRGITKPIIPWLPLFSSNVICKPYTVACVVIGLSLILVIFNNT